MMQRDNNSLKRSNTCNTCNLLSAGGEKSVFPAAAAAAAHRNLFCRGIEAGVVLGGGEAEECGRKVPQKPEPSAEERL
jgi:hypothetical protein